MHKARHRQVGTWPLCLSAFQRVCGVNIYFTLIYTSKGEKKDVSVTFSKCQIWREKDKERREREEGYLRDLSRYASHNLFLFIWERLTEHALYQKHTSGFTLILKQFHTQKLCVQISGGR